MHNLSFDFRELKFRILYSSLAWLLSSLCVYSLFEEALFALSPAIPTFFLYSNAFDVLFSKVSLSLTLGWWLALPHISWTLYLFFRPGLFRSEALNFPLFFWIFSPWFFYFSALLFVSWNLHNFSSYFYRYLPTLSSAGSFISSLLLLCNLLSLFIFLFRFSLHKSPSWYPRYRLLLIYFFSAFFASILPPDLSYLLAVFFLSFFLLEILFFLFFLGQAYDNFLVRKP